MWVRGPATHCSDTESPMTRQLGRVVEGSIGGPGAQQLEVPAKMHPFAPKYCATQQVAFAGHALWPSPPVALQSRKPGAADSTNSAALTAVAAIMTPDVTAARKCACVREVAYGVPR